MVSPWICKLDAVLRISVRSFCFTEMLPLYMYSISNFIWSSGMSFKKTVGCLHGLLMNKFLKYGLQADSISLCAWNDLVSVDRVTSVNWFS